MSDKRFRDRPVDQVHVLPPSVDDYVSDKSRLALFVHDLVRNRLVLAEIKGAVRVHPLMRLRLDTGAPRILGKQQKAQETEFRHPEAVAFFARFDGRGGSAADSAGDRQHRSPDIRA